jgi:hypothetical protein
MVQNPNNSNRKIGLIKMGFDGLSNIVCYGKAKASRAGKG